MNCVHLDALAPKQLIAISELLKLTGMMIDDAYVMMNLLGTLVSCIVVTAMKGVGIALDLPTLSVTTVPNMHI